MLVEEDHVAVWIGDGEAGGPARGVCGRIPAHVETERGELGTKLSHVGAVIPVETACNSAANPSYSSIVSLLARVARM